VASFFTFIIAAVIYGQLNPGCDNDSCPIYVIWLVTMAANGIVVSLATTILNAIFVGIYAETLPFLAGPSRDAGLTLQPQPQPPFQGFAQTSSSFGASGSGGEPKVADNLGAVAIELPRNRN